MINLLKRFIFFGAPGRNRTCGAWIRNPMLYPLSYGGNMINKNKCL